MFGKPFLIAAGLALLFGLLNLLQWHSARANKAEWKAEVSRLTVERDNAAAAVIGSRTTIAALQHELARRDFEDQAMAKRQKDAIAMAEQKAAEASQEAQEARRKLARWERIPECQRVLEIDLGEVCG